jgi:hypothetical protein
LAKYIPNWEPKDQILGFVNISSKSLITLSQALFDEESLQSYHMKTLIHLLRTITYRTKLYYFLNQNSIDIEVMVHKRRLQSLELLASNLLVCLCSSDRDIWVMTTKCLRDICDQIDILQNQEIKYLNYSFYSKLTNVDLNADFNEERKKQIQLFRRIETQTRSNLTAFNEIYERWKKSIEKQEEREGIIFIKKISNGKLYKNVMCIRCCMFNDRKINSKKRK